MWSYKTECTISLILQIYSTIPHTTLHMNIFSSNLSQTHIALLTGIALGVLSGWLLIPEETSKYVITYTDNGYQPSTLTIPLGSKVTFRNNSTNPHWPASDLHPSHNLYAEFDPQEAILPNKNWAFIFDTPGLWAFHNHLQSFQGGHITVLNKDNSVPSLNCTDKQNDIDCWSASLVLILKTKGLASAYDYLKKLHQTEPDFAPRCHSFAHDLGLKTYIYYGSSLTMIPETGYCNGGFYHGYLEGMINDLFNLTEVEEFCTQVGLDISDVYPNAENQCRHGIGHGLGEHIIYTNTYMWGDPNSMYEKATDWCDGLNDSYDQKMRCASGAISVVVDWAFSDKNFTHYLEPEFILNLCQQQGKEFSKDGCYWEVSKRMIFINEYDPTKTFDTLIKFFPMADTDKYLGRSIRSISNIFGKTRIYEDDETTINFCRTNLPTADLQSYCLIGMVEGMLFSGEPGNEGERALKFCNATSMYPNEKTSCYKSVQDIISDSSQNLFISVCSDTPDVYKTKKCLDLI